MMKTNRILGIDWGTRNFSYCIIDVELLSKKEIKSIKVIEWKIVDLILAREITLSRECSKESCTNNAYVIYKDLDIISDSICLKHSSFKPKKQQNQKKQKNKNTKDTTAVTAVTAYKDLVIKKSSNINTNSTYRGIDTCYKNISDIKINLKLTIQNRLVMDNLIQLMDNLLLKYEEKKAKTTFDIIGIEDQRNYSHKHGKLSHALWGYFCTRLTDTTTISFISASRRLKVYNGPKIIFPKELQTRLSKMKAKSRNYCRNKELATRQCIWFLENKIKKSEQEYHESYLKILKSLNSKLDNDMADSFLIAIASII